MELHEHWTPFDFENTNNSYTYDWNTMYQIGTLDPFLFQMKPAWYGRTDTQAERAYIIMDPLWGGAWESIVETIDKHMPSAKRKRERERERLVGQMASALTTAAANTVPYPYTHMPNRMHITKPWFCRHSTLYTWKKLSLLLIMW